MKVHVADNHNLIIEGITVLLEKYDINIVGTSNNGSELLAWLKENTCDVLLLDMSMPYCNGIEVLKRLHADGSKQKIIIISAYKEIDFIKEALKYGALGFILKEEAHQCLVKAIHAVYTGTSFYSEQIQETIIKAQVELGKEKKINQVLSSKEYNILSLLTEDNTPKEISKKLNISLSTIRTYTERMRDKLEVKTTIGLVKLFFNSKKK